jgi:tetratricopeptide (TPR) repeat protein
MRRFALVTTATAAALLAAAGLVATRHGASRADAATVPAAPPRDPVAEASARDADIALFESRVIEDPASAADRSRLAALYLRRARETGAFADVTRAREQAERSLVLREAHNEGTWSILASARLAEHDFTGALDAAKALVATDTTDANSLALEGEVLLELGRYDEAAARFVAVERAPATLSLAPRLARWYELTGHLDRAVLMARNALRLAKVNVGISAEQQAWFLMRAGDLEAKRGRARVAAALYDSARAANAGDYRVLAAVARLDAQRGRWREAISAGDSSLLMRLEPGTLGVLREAWLAVGDSAQAESYAAAMTASALTQPGAIHRAWGLHLVNHRERLDDVLRRVRRELQSRRDIYGYDLEGWTLHALGRDREAARAMQKALAAGTEDAVLWYHAGVVAAAVGDSAAARLHLRRALALNPEFGVQEVARTKALLAVLPLESPVATAARIAGVTP